MATNTTTAPAGSADSNGVVRTRPAVARRIVTWLRRPPLWITLTVCAVILAARRPDLLRTPQFWAEDGPVFFLQAHILGLDALWQPSAGYLHTILRLIATLATFVDPTLAPALYTAAAAGLTLYVAARTQTRRLPLPPSIGYALAVVLVPDAGEVMLNLTNLQWILAGGIFLILISRDATTPLQRAHDVIALGLLGLTGPFIVVLAPLFAWRAWHRRSRASITLAGIAVTTGTLQLAVILAQLQAANTGEIALETAIGIPGVRVGASLLTGGRVDSGIGLPFATLLGVATLAVIAWLAWRRGVAREERIWLFAGFLALLEIALFRCRGDLPALFHGAGPRYFFPLQLLALWLVIATAAQSRPGSTGWIARAAIVVFACMNLSRWREPAFADLQWTEAAASIRRGEQVTVSINPEGWRFTVPGHHPAVAMPTIGSGSHEPGSRAGMLNMSTRCFVTPERPAIIGFMLGDGPPRRLLVRAVGPSLAQFGVTSHLQRPNVTLLKDAVEECALTLVRNGDTDPLLREMAAHCGAFPLKSGGGDLAGIVVLHPGKYSLIVSTSERAGGDVLLELYEIALSGGAVSGQ